MLRFVPEVYNALIKCRWGGETMQT